MNKPNSSFRDSLDELESITQQLESDKIGLDEAIEHFERGSKLAAQLQTELKKAQLKVEKIKARFDTEQPAVDIATESDSSSEERLDTEL